MTRDSTRKEGRAHPDDPRVRILLHHIAAACRNTLGDTLAGVYVHGSLAFGCFCWTQSDIDFLVAVRRPLSQAQKEALLRALLALGPELEQELLPVPGLLALPRRNAESGCNHLLFQALLHTVFR